MISADLGHELCLEDRIRVYELQRVRQLFLNGTPFVLQAPGICRYVHMLSAPDVAIVLMRRDVKDIVTSEKRIKWFGSVHNKQELERYGLAEGNIAEVKYQYWDGTQRELIHNPFEVEYESLVAHPMWIPREGRVGFRSRQYKHA